MMSDAIENAIECSKALEAKLKSKDDHISQLGKKVEGLEIKLNRTRKNVFFGM